MSEDVITAVIAIDIIPGTHKEVYQFIQNEISNYLKELLVVFGKPDIFALVEAQTLSDLASITTTIAINSNVVKTDTKVCVPKKMLRYP